MRLLAIDPGPEGSALVMYDTEHGVPTGWMKRPNEEIAEWITAAITADRMAVEMIASYGMPVGREVFETCVWIGRFIETWMYGDPGRTRSVPFRVTRQECKLHLCGSPRAGDPNVRQALIDRYGPGKDQAIGRKASPGPLYGLTGDCWAALAVAVTVADTMAMGAAA